MISVWWWCKSSLVWHNLQHATWLKCLPPHVCREPGFRSWCWRRIQPCHDNMYSPALYRELFALLSLLKEKQSSSLFVLFCRKPFQLDGIGAVGNTFLCSPWPLFSLVLSHWNTGPMKGVWGCCGTRVMVYVVHHGNCKPILHKLWRQNTLILELCTHWVCNVSVNGDNPVIGRWHAKPVQSVYQSPFSGLRMDFQSNINRQRSLLLPCMPMYLLLVSLDRFQLLKAVSWAMNSTACGCFWPFSVDSTSNDEPGPSRIMLRRALE